MSEIPVLTMAQPLPGFPEQRRFTMTRLVDDGTICDLRSVDDPAVSFVVIPPAEFFDGYEPELDDDTVAALELRDADDVVVLALLTLGASPADATANLRAPIVVNHRTRQALQVILDDATLPLQAPLASRREVVRTGTQD